MTRTRYDLTHPKGQKNLQIYAEAVSMMKGQTQLPKSALKSDIRKVLDRYNDTFIDNDSRLNWINDAEMQRENYAHFTPHF